MQEPHITILETVAELPFAVGKKTLTDVLIGAVTQKIVTNDAYMDCDGYGTLQSMGRAATEALIEKLLSAGLLRTTSPPNKPYWRLLEITLAGREELRHPQWEALSFKNQYTNSNPSKETKRLTQEFSFFLEQYNAEQQQAIVTPGNKVLCVAGAGTGKTTVLTKRAEFLAQYRGVPPKKILCITFTRKAQQEMRSRLSTPVHVLTFNAFCEQLLRKNGRTKPIISYAQKIRFFQQALKTHDLELSSLLHEYYSPAQRRGMTQEELTQRLMRDTYSILDHFSNEDQPLPTTGQNNLANTLLQLANTLQKLMQARGVRDYSDQVREALTLLRTHPETIPRYEHVLVDEYQDINKAQQTLLELLDPESMFVVGDPRQSIYGWRGSEIRYIKDYPADVTVQLMINYRSRPSIITLANNVIRRMSLPDLVPSREDGGLVQELVYKNETEEYKSIAALLQNTKSKDVFVLARTNKQLRELSYILQTQKIAHTVREEESETTPTGITLATVHAIKGLEADTVIITGASNKYFPIKTSDHPIIDLIKTGTLDREEEELRLFYVAISRAREHLIITHTNSRTYFLDTPATTQNKQETLTTRNDEVYNKLRAWRSTEAKQRGVPAYTIANDKTLRELSTQQPRTQQELHNIHGLGTKRIEEFGKDILTILQG